MESHSRPPPLSMSSSVSWGSREMALPASPIPLDTALRMLDGTCGLFDTEFAGDQELKESSAGSLELNFLETTDKLPSFGNPSVITDPRSSLASSAESITGLSDDGTEFLFSSESDKVDLARSINAIKQEFEQISNEPVVDDVFTVAEPSLVPPVDVNEDSLMNDLANIDFLENCTDLATYLSPEMLTGDGALDQFDLMETSPSEDLAQLLGQGIKRSASEAFEEDVTMVMNPDHNDYTMKLPDGPVAKRGRPAAPPPQSTPTRETLGSSSSMMSCLSEASTSASSSVGKADSKYRERRRKNNIASRRSRETRKQKFANMDEQAHNLEQDNARLREKVAELEKLTKIMKEALISTLAGVKEEA